MARRYQTVHGRRARGSKKWIAAAAVLAVVVIVLAVAFVVIPGLQKRKPQNVPAGTQATAPAKVPSGSPDEPAAPSSSPAPTPTPQPTPTPAPTPPPIPDDGSDGYLSEGLYLWQNKAFELFYGDDDAARAYAEAISSYGDRLAGRQVYDMVVPNHSEFGLPERIRDAMGCTSQRQNTRTVYETLSSQVKPVDIYDALDLHKDEYLYFNTDTHWAPLGAYYAYTVFCSQAGVKAAELSDFEKTSVEGFTGYLYAVTGESCLAENPDRIDLYEPKALYTAELSADGVTFQDLGTIHSPDESMGYSMILWGDNPCVRLTNEESHTGRKLVLVKDSYGNALAPFLCASFDEVHVLDFRSFPQNLTEYCAGQGITDVLFFNNVMSANTYSQIETMNGLFS